MYLKSEFKQTLRTISKCLMAHSFKFRYQCMFVDEYPWNKAKRVNNVSFQFIKLPDKIYISMHGFNIFFSTDEWRICIKNYKKKTFVWFRINKIILQWNTHKLVLVKRKLIWKLVKSGELLYCHSIWLHSLVVILSQYLATSARCYIVTVIGYIR